MKTPVTDEFLSQRPLTRSFEVFFDLRLNMRLSKQSRHWWYETPLCSLWRPCYGHIAQNAYKELCHSSEFLSTIWLWTSQTSPLPLVRQYMSIKPYYFTVQSTVCLMPVQSKNTTAQLWISNPFCWESTGKRWVPRLGDRYCAICVHVLTSSWNRVPCGCWWDHEVLPRSQWNSHGKYEHEYNHINLTKVHI